ncbi:MAG TPA: response regulator [Verrucomicrobiae bacterium]|nr:response regulator [Verrucomicrobiae bacterium]
MTILMVDSDAAHRERIARMLRNHGLRVLEASGYRDAENTWQRHPGEISVLVTAMALPERNGYELASRLRANEPNIKVLLISGPTGAVISEFHANLVEGADTLFRPFKGAELVNKILSLLKGGLAGSAEA